jgi:glycosyltransferase involved in cell wall biosynthesis
LTGLFGQIAKFRPDVIVTSEVIPGNLNIAGFELRKRWIHVKPDATDESVTNAIDSCYASNIWGEHPREKIEPLVSVYTGTYNTGDVLRDTYGSLRDQTYQNWEWVVVDDESTDGTWDRLLQIADEDIRVRPMQVKHNGKIGYIKDLATRMANGKYLIELDHDDSLTDTAVDDVRKVFDEDSEVGMVYTNCASFFPDGSPHMFGDDFWKVRYRDTEYHGKVYKECLQPNMWDRFSPHPLHQFFTFLTVGPNHIRAYRTDVLRKLGGYNRNLPVADDLDVFMRFALASSPPELGGSR